MCHIVETHLLLWIFSPSCGHPSTFLIITSNHTNYIPCYAQKAGGRLEIYYKNRPPGNENYAMLFFFGFQKELHYAVFFGFQKVMLLATVPFKNFRGIPMMFLTTRQSEEFVIPQCFKVVKQ